MTDNNSIKEKIKQIDETISQATDSMNKMIDSMNKKTDDINLRIINLKKEFNIKLTDQENNFLFNNKC